MEDHRASGVDPQLSQAKTVAGDPLPFPPGSSGTRGRAIPAFPVKHWDRYEFLGFLGQGGMGAVFLGRDRRLGREVALKFVHLEDERHLERFMVEARAQARVDHEHVCKVFEVGEVEGKVFIAMQRIAGASLDVVAPRLSLEQKLIVLRDAARGAHEAHRMGIIHRDLKPSNIMVETGEDGACRTYLMDFGLAREWNQEVTETGSVLGTPAYMSPEQARGVVSNLDRRTDVYSLGATLYHALLERPPFIGANSLEVLSAITSAEVPAPRSLRPDLSRDLEAITLKCLEKDRARRYSSAKSLADDLDRFLAGEPVFARPTGFLYRLQRKLQKHWQLALVIGSALLVVLAALGSTFLTRREARRRERLVQRFTESMGHIEALARYSALSPLHDIRPDLQTVKTSMAQLEGDMRQAGPLANGPGHYALGRGYWILDDGEQAREHLQMAWDAGFREPRAAYALALVLGRQYQERLLEAERTPSLDQREALKKEIGTKWLEPALGFLRQAKGSEVPSPAYLEALLAFYEGRLDEALDRLKRLEEVQPWFYEAPLLRGTVLQARAWKRWNQGAREAAHADFEAGRAALSTAAFSGRSVPSIYAALAGLELNALLMEKYGQGKVGPAFDRGLRAVQSALAAQPDHVPSLILHAALVGNLAEFQMDHGQRADELVEQAVASASKALEAGPTRADAWAALGQAYYRWGSARQDQNLDPSEQLAKGQRALESLSPEKRDYLVENHLGLIHQTRSDFEAQHGRDPAPHLNGAIAAYERATRMAPHLLPAWINWGTCLQQRATLPRAPDPEGDLRAALGVLDQAIGLNPKHFVPYFVKSKVFCDLARRRWERGENPEPDLQRSLEASRQGLLINQRVPHLHNGLGMADSLRARWTWETGGDPAPLILQAREAFQKAIAAAPNQVYGYLNLADLFIWQARTGSAATTSSFLHEARAAIHQAQTVAPGNRGPLVALGRWHSVRLETERWAGPGALQAQAEGEAALAKALALDPDDRDALLYLGGLRLAGARWKAEHQWAEARDFDLASVAFDACLGVDPESQEAQAGLVRLAGARAVWARSHEGAPEQSLALGWSRLEPLLKRRPQWGEAVLLRGLLSLAEAESLAPGRRRKAAEALGRFEEALALNRNLGEQAKPWQARALRLAKISPE